MYCLTKDHRQWNALPGRQLLELLVELIRKHYRGALHYIIMAVATYQLPSSLGYEMKLQPTKVFAIKIG